MSSLPGIARHLRPTTVPRAHRHEPEMALCPVRRQPGNSIESTSRAAGISRQGKPIHDPSARTTRHGLAAKPYTSVGIVAEYAGGGEWDGPVTTLASS